MGSLADAAGRRYRVPAIALDGDSEKWLRELAIGVHGLFQGKMNNTGEFTCTANTSETTITDPRIGANSVLLVMPTTANAAAEIATLYFDTFTDGSCKANHANNANADRTFRYAIFG